MFWDISLLTVGIEPKEEERLLKSIPFILPVGLLGEGERGETTLDCIDKFPGAPSETVEVLWEDDCVDRNTN